MNLREVAKSNCLIAEKKDTRMLKYLLVVLLETVPIFVYAASNTISEYDEKIASIKKLGSASIELANKDIEIELTENPIVWLQSENKEFDAYLNQGVAFLHVFHYIDALRSFKMAHKINPQSLYPVVGMIFSYMSLSMGDSRPFIEKLILENENSVESASQREKLWYNLAVSILMTQIYYIPMMKYSNDKPPQDAYLDLLNFDPNDLETLTLGAYMARLNQAESYLKALEIEPHHTGANHYLVHFKEHTGRPAEALEYAQTFYENAPYSAHAVHMLGHILPTVGRWSEAKALFKKADEIHLAWSQRNEVSPEEDWHYLHNLHLLFVTHVSLGEFEEADKIIKNLCSLNADAYFCLQSYSLYNIMDNPDSVQKRHQQIITEHSNSKDYLQPLLDEIALLKGTPFNQITSVNMFSPFRNEVLWHLKLVDLIIKSQSVEDCRLKRELIHGIEQYIAFTVPQVGLDSFSLWLLNSLRILSVTARMKDKELYNATLTAIRKHANEFEFDLYNHVEGVNPAREDNTGLECFSQ